MGEIWWISQTAENDGSLMMNHNDGSFLIFQLGFLRQIMRVHYDGSLLRFIKNGFLSQQEKSRIFTVFKDAT